GCRISRLASPTDIVPASRQSALKSVLVGELESTWAGSAASATSASCPYVAGSSPSPLRPQNRVNVRIRLHDVSGRSAAIVDASPCLVFFFPAHRVARETRWGRRSPACRVIAEFIGLALQDRFVTLRSILGHHLSCDLLLLVFVLQNRCVN